MLTLEQVIPFLAHADPIVREHALRYFRDSYDIGPLTADHYWQVIDSLGMNGTSLGFVARLDSVPQTEASYQRLMRALGERPPDSHEFHLQHAVGALDLKLVIEHRDELLACAAILPHVRDHLRQRLALAEEPLEPLWERLMELGKSLADSYADRLDERVPERLIEALARRPDEFFERAMRVMDDPEAAEDWREIFAVQFIGAARHEPAIDALIAKLAIDADVLRERVSDALSQIGTPEVAEKIEAFYPGKEWPVRLYASSPLPRIKRPECETALYRLCDHEPDDERRVSLLNDLCELCSLQGFERSRAAVAEDEQDAERLGLAEALIAVATMTGAELPEESHWRKLLARRDAGVAARIANFDALFAKGMRDNWRRDGIRTPASEYDDTDLDDDADDPLDISHIDDLPAIAPTTYVRSDPKVGRNDPCPCNSGKKYKKCCGK